MKDSGRWTKPFQERMKARQVEQPQAAATQTKRTLPTIPSASAQSQSRPSQPRPAASQTASSNIGDKSHFCPYCGKDLDWKYCPYCGKKLT